jgi:hypothetical protein
MKMRWKSGKRAPLASELAIGAGGLLMAWGYRRWRRRMKEDVAAGREGDTGEAGADSASKAQARSLSDRWRTLDEEASGSHIPKELERMPKGSE